MAHFKRVKYNLDWMATEIQNGGFIEDDRFFVVVSVCWFCTSWFCLPLCDKWPLQFNQTTLTRSLNRQSHVKRFLSVYPNKP